MKTYLYLFKYYWKYTYNCHMTVVLVFLLHILCFSFKMAEPFIVAWILNAIQLDPTTKVLPIVFRLLCLLFFTDLVHNLLHRLGDYVRVKAAFKARQNFINHYYQKVANFPMKWHADNHSGNTINRINTAGNALFTYSETQHIYISLYFSFFIPAITIVVFDVWAGLLAVALTLLTLVISKGFDNAVMKTLKQMNERMHILMATFFDFISNIRTVIILKLTTKSAKSLDESMNYVWPPYIKSFGFITPMRWGIIDLFITIINTVPAFIFIAGQLSRNKMIMIGDVSVLIQMLNKLSKAFRGMASEEFKLVRLKTDLLSIEPLECLDETKELSGRIKKTWKKIEIRNINFTHNSTECKVSKSVLNDLSLIIRKGEHIALQGESGAGKSTLMALLRGLYKIDGAEVFVDGVRCADGIICLRDIVTLMPQDPEVFENTIEYNITMGIKYPKKLVTKAIETARFEKVLNKLPDGLATDIREKGVNLSGGERQRLALARNILAAMNSDIILMDEPTSSIDVPNETAIYANILDLFKDKTVISSVHKPYLVKYFNRTVKLYNGKIQEE